MAGYAPIAELSITVPTSTYEALLDQAASPRIPGTPRAWTKLDTNDHRTISFLIDGVLPPMGDLEADAATDNGDPKEIQGRVRPDYSQ